MQTKGLTKKNSLRVNSSLSRHECVIHTMADTLFIKLILPQTNVCNYKDKPAIKNRLGNKDVKG